MTRGIRFHHPFPKGASHSLEISGCSVIFFTTNIFNPKNHGISKTGGLEIQKNPWQKTHPNTSNSQDYPWFLGKGKRTWIITFHQPQLPDQTNWLLKHLKINTNFRQQKRIFLPWNDLQILTLNGFGVRFFRKDLQNFAADPTKCRNMLSFYTRWAPTFLLNQVGEITPVTHWFSAIYKGCNHSCNWFLGPPCTGSKKKLSWMIWGEQVFHTVDVSDILSMEFPGSPNRW